MPKIEYRCEVCDITFLAYESANRRFCSNACTYKGQKGKKRKARHSTKVCEWCGGPRAYNAKRFCSRDCLNAHISKANGHDRWAINEYDANFTHAFRYLIRSMDGHKCQICGVYCNPDYKKVWPTNGVNSVIHHIDANKNRTTVFNCILLCCGCHAKVHYEMEYWQPILQEIADKFHERT